MDRVYKHFVAIAALALSLTLLLQCVHQSQFIRLMGDDYGYLGGALEFGTWEAMRNARARWNGDYTNFLLYGLIAPFGARAPALITSVFFAIGIVSFCALVLRVLAYFGLGRHRLLAALAMASLILVAYIYGAYTPITFYWLTGCIEYSLPAVALAACLALGTAAVKWARSRSRLTVAAIAFAALGFMVAGFSEMYLVFQSATLSVLGIGALVFARGRVRRAYAVIIAAALAGTAASLALQMTSLGVQRRLAMTEYWDQPVERVRDLPALIVGVAEFTPGFLTDQNAISGFKLLAASGLAVTLALSQPVSRRSRETRKVASPWPFVLTLIIQCAFLPYLWSHSSDSLIFFGRFSYSYMLIISLNIVLVIAAAAMVYRPMRLRDYLNTPPGQIYYSSAVLLLTGALFAVPEVLGIADRAYDYCLVTSFLLAGVLLWQLAYDFADRSDRRARRIGALTLFSAVLTIAVLAIMLAVALRLQGFLYDYIFTAVVFPFVFTGFLWGASVGSLIHRQLSIANARISLPRWGGLLSLLVAAAISWAIFTAQAKLTDDLKEGARIWDATYQEILMLRDTHPTEIAHREFGFRHYHISRIWPLETRVRRLQRREVIFFMLS